GKLLMADQDEWDSEEMMKLVREQNAEKPQPLHKYAADPYLADAFEDPKESAEEEVSLRTEIIFYIAIVAAIGAVMCFRWYY
ncbi:hypothetical protein GP486_008870, partial [Trichoglossum hirsutum]